MITPDQKSENPGFLEFSPVFFKKTTTKNNTRLLQGKAGSLALEDNQI